ncbi:structure-specific endonuclease subunit SLX4-like [Ahaetulla prasina]|uniref:structure-specific endonuclease subunit SLX4-like n=1 Tax=Ahaetulla prasina TaxID=499056 RepID=UPI002646FF58|nr:structure-specific endonuclease subunit SLX4-like [Ahaetulla prasina]
MGDSEDEFRWRDPLGRRRGEAARGIGTGAAPAAAPSPVPPERGLKRGGAPRLPGRKRRREADGEPLVVPAKSRSEAGPGGRRPRAETKGHGRPPPPLLLQGPEDASRGLEARAALLLLEAPAAPRTPPLPTSRWKGAPANARPGWLWELSSLTGTPAVAPWEADQVRGCGEASGSSPGSSLPLGGS